MMTKMHLETNWYKSQLAQLSHLFSRAPPPPPAGRRVLSPRLVATHHTVQGEQLMVQC
jgi:hypothetical protein